jgi:hypothetical protein
MKRKKMRFTCFLLWTQRHGDLMKLGGSLLLSNSYRTDDSMNRVRGAKFSPHNPILLSRMFYSRVGGIVSPTRHIWLLFLHFQFLPYHRGTVCTYPLTY